MDCTKIGWAVQRLGAGRTRPGDPVSAHAGIEMHAKLGDRVEAGQPLATLFSEDAALLDEPEQMLRETLQIAAHPTAAHPAHPRDHREGIHRQRQAYGLVIFRSVTTASVLCAKRIP